MRDVQVANDLYVGVLNNIQQLQLVQVDKVGRVRQLDSARVPWEPAKPKKPLVIAIAAILGLMLGVIAAYVREGLFGGVTNAQEIEQHTGLNVLCDGAVFEITVRFHEGHQRPQARKACASAALSARVVRGKSARVPNLLAARDAECAEQSRAADGRDLRASASRSFRLISQP